MWDFVKNYEKSPKLATFRANCHVLGFSNFQEKVAKSVDFVENRQNSPIWPKLGFCEKPFKQSSIWPKTPKSSGHKYSQSRRGQKRPRRNISIATIIIITESEKVIIIIIIIIN